MMRIFSCTSLVSSSGAILGAAALIFVSLSPAQAAPNTRAAFLRSAARQPNVLYTLKLPHGESAVVYKNGIARVFTADFGAVSTRYVSGFAKGPALTRPSKAEVRAELSKPVHHHPYASDEVLVVYRSGVTATQDRLIVPVSKLRAMRRVQAKGRLRENAKITLPKYTTNAKVNALLARLGVDRSMRLFRSLSKGRLHAMVARASAALGHHLLNISNAYELHITHSSVRHAVAVLRRSGVVAYASPAFYVAAMHTRSVPLSRLGSSHVPPRTRRPALVKHAGAQAEADQPTSHLPSNYGLQSSLQSAFNAPSLNAAAAYDEIVQSFGQLPGTGEIITNVSLGTLTDTSAAQDPNDPCNFYASAYGPTTIMQGGQRYLNFPSMPLIPTYTVDANGNLDGGGEVCGPTDPLLHEIGLDFSVMAPLPHDRQRPGEVGSGETDLLGIAPGADYRLVVPENDPATIADIDSALLAAALQTPRPDVITASIGFGEDRYGFPQRYLGDDPLSAAIIGAIVNNYHVVVTIAANDGLPYTFTNAAVSPSGGSAPTNVSHGDPTTLGDVYFSTAPSRDPDTGAIDVGGTTLDDVFAAPPQNSANAALKAQHAFAEVRWTGSRSFSSGYGSRVNVSAPSDNVIAFSHAYGGDADAVNVGLIGGTSASAPEVAAAAAVVMQVARLTGQAFPDPRAVRTFLEQTGTPVPKVPQSDVHNHVGPQVNLGHAVETLLAQAGNAVTPQVTSVAVEQRRGERSFRTDTNPSYIDLSGFNARNWITIAPDWEDMPANTSYTLRVQPLTGTRMKHSVTKIAPAASVSGGVLAHTAWARVLPKKIFEAAAPPFVSNSLRTLLFTYTATPPGTTAQPLTAKFVLRFGPVAADWTSKVLAPTVPSVVHGATIPVHYDLTHSRLDNATLEVSYPGRFLSLFFGLSHRAAYTVPISGKGTVDVPVSALQGGGVYAIAIIQNDPHALSPFAFTRVQPEPSSARPPAPLLSANGSRPGHLLGISYGEAATISWDVSNVPGATGAILEVSAPGPNWHGTYNLFNNPNGSERDANGVDTGSLYYMRLPGGVSGTKTFKGSDLAKVLAPGMYENLRVLPVAGGSVVGEAGRVSTITMAGLSPADGGSIENGWGINGNGLDGFLTSVQTTASGDVLSSLETFNQASNTITQVVESKTGHVYSTPGYAGIFGDDIALFSDQNINTGTISYHTLDPVADGSIGSQWTPPQLGGFVEAAPNHDSAVGFFYGQDPETLNYVVYTSNIPENTFSPLLNVSNVLDRFFDSSAPFGIAENPNTHTGLLVVGDLNFITAFSEHPVLVTIDLDTGKIKHAFKGVGLDWPTGVAVDTHTDTAAVPVLRGAVVGIYNGNTGEMIKTKLPGGDINNGEYVAADPEHGLFLIVQPTPGDEFDNNNATAAVQVLDEQGNLIETIERFNFGGAFLPWRAHNIQINPTLRQGYVIGPNNRQLIPFKY